MSARLIDRLGSKPVTSHSHEKSSDRSSCEVIKKLQETYKKRLNDEQTSSSSRRLKRFRMDVDSEAVMSIVEQLQSKDVSAISADLWDATKILMRSGYISLQSCPDLIEKAKLSSRYDVLIELIRTVCDVTVADIVNIWMHCLESTVENSELTKHFGALLKDTHFGSILSELEPANENVLNLLALIVESILLRSSAFTLEEISEESKLMSPDACFLFLRLLALIIRASFGTSLSRNFDETQVERAIVWLTGIIDGHFAILLLEVKRNTSCRTFFQQVVSSIELGKRCLYSTELALKFSSQIKRMCAAQSHSTEEKVQRGLYETEVLEL